MKNSYFTEIEIISQPEAWEQAIEIAITNASEIQSLLKNRPDQLIFTGCGSTYYLALAASALFQELSGSTARAVPAGDLLLNPQVYLPADQKLLLVAISRSGSTTETLAAVNRFHAEHQGEVVVISNDDSTPLTGLGDLSMVVSKGKEQSVAQTRSFTSLYVASCGFNALAAGRSDLIEDLASLPRTGEHIICSYREMAGDLGSDLSKDRFYFLGNGFRYGLACEASLKLKEMSLTHSEPFHFLEFRHGPMSMVTDKTMIAGMLSETNLPNEKRVLDEMTGLGANCLSLAETAADVSFESHILEPLRGVLNLPVLQMLAFYRAIAKGLDPDKPKNLSAVVELETLTET